MKSLVAGIAGLMLMSMIGQATEYYVDADHGDDGRSGINPGLAWRTLDRLNRAELKPGDTVRFKRGCQWRGFLKPRSGSEGAPVTYTSYGEGDKPLLLGSVSRSEASDWEMVKPGIWATKRPSFTRIGSPVDCRNGDWRRHQENGAKVTFVATPNDKGTIYRMECTANGTRTNHIQLWGLFPKWELVEGADLLEFRFRARSTKAFNTGPVSVRLGRLPWSIYGAANSVTVGSEWREHSARLVMKAKGDMPRLHLSLGDRLPEGAVFEFQPLDFIPLKSSGPSPLAVDVGNIICEHGKACGWKKWSVDTLVNPLDYFYDSETCRVFLRSDENPGTLYKSIELALKGHIVSQSGRHHVVYDGLALRYGASHGFGGGNTAFITIRNCDLSYIGGAHQFTKRGRPVRFGNAIEFWGACRNNLVENCRIWEVYDAALTNQGRGPTSKQINITYRNNIIWNSEYSFEYWNNPETAETRNIRFVNNTCVDAGVVWSHAQRPNPNGSHLMLYTNTAQTSGIEIKYNVFCQTSDWGSRFSRGWDPRPAQDYNLWYQPDGFLSHWFGKKLPADDIKGYREKTGLDEHSVFADPKFVAPDKRDYRLQPDSPARTVRPDGGIVGAESLWQAGNSK